MRERFVAIALSWKLDHYSGIVRHLDIAPPQAIDLMMIRGNERYNFYLNFGILSEPARVEVFKLVHAHLEQIAQVADNYEVQFPKG